MLRRGLRSKVNYDHIGIFCQEHFVKGLNVMRSTDPELIGASLKEH